jgi:hypothetical protein
MELTTHDKDELRELIQQEISKAFNAAFSAALNPPATNLGDALSTEYRQEREQRKKIIMEIGNAIKSALEDVRTEAQAKVVEKTDPARADVIRRLKPTF